MIVILTTNCFTCLFSSDAKVSIAQKQQRRGCSGSEAHAIAQINAKSAVVLISLQLECVRRPNNQHQAIANKKPPLKRVFCIYTLLNTSLFSPAHKARAFFKEFQREQGLQLFGSRELGYHAINKTNAAQIKRPIVKTLPKSTKTLALTIVSSNPT
jgi:hypothetical protein